MYQFCNCEFIVRFPYEVGWHLLLDRGRFWLQSGYLTLNFHTVDVAGNHNALTLVALWAAVVLVKHCRLSVCLHFAVDPYSYFSQWFLK